MTESLNDPLIHDDPPPPPPVPPLGWTPEPLNARRWPKRVAIGVAIWLGVSALAYPFHPDGYPYDHPPTTVQP